MANNLHKGHRERVRARFIRDGSLDSFEAHQILEFLLFYPITRRDTNELAHRLLNEYGSLHGLLNAKPNDIMKRCKVSESTAVLLSMIPHLARKFLQSSMVNENICVNSSEIASKYFSSNLAGQPFESFYVLCLDLNKKYKNFIKISDGNTSSSPVYMDKLVHSVLSHNSSFVIIGHNHPSGNSKPSSSDINITNTVYHTLKALNITLLDHIIVYGDDYFSFANKNLCNLKYT